MTAVATEMPSVRKPTRRRICVEAIPPKKRGMREFLEAELVLPKGSPLGRRFRCDAIPATGLILDVFESGRYREHWAAASVQGGKTLLFGAAMALYYCCEMEWPIVYGGPDQDRVYSIWKRRIEPSFRRNPKYRGLLPTAGLGSRGGKVESLTLNNGVSVFFMGGGGGSAQRAGETARVAIITEVNKGPRKRIADDEPDWVTEILARTEAFGEGAIIYGECTQTTSVGRINQEVEVYGTNHRIWLPCRHCGEYLVPNREHFVGWQEAPSRAAARRNAGYACDCCGAVWTEPDRAWSIHRPVLAGADQKVAANGRVSGPEPDSPSFGVAWNQMHVPAPMVAMSNIADKEFRADREGSTAQRRRVFQLTWARPYDEDLEDLSQLDRDEVAGHQSELPRGVAPPGARLLVGLDLGRYQCWWVALAVSAEGAGYVIAYNVIEVAHPGKPDDANILPAIRAFRDEALYTGWRFGGIEGPPAMPDLVLVDSGYVSEVAYTFCTESGRRYLPCKGLGTSPSQQGWTGEGRRSKTRIPGREWFFSRQDAPGRRFWLLMSHSDHWKRQVQNGFRAPVGAPGSLGLFRQEQRQHYGFARQILAEVEVREFIEGRGEVLKWNRTDKYNHYLDALGMALAGADILRERPTVQGDQRAGTGATESGGWVIGRG